MNKLAFLVAACILPVEAQAALVGEWGLSGTATCLNSATGFNAALQPTSAPSISVFAITGSYVFNPNGTGTFKLISTSIDFSTTAAGAGSSVTAITPFTYTINADTITVNGEMVSGTITSGARVGETFTYNMPPLSGWISKGSHSENIGNLLPVRTLTLTTLSPFIETLTYSVAPSPVYRICVGTVVLTDLPY